MIISGRQYVLFTVLATFILAACTTGPPAEQGNFQSTDLVELIDMDSTLQLDIRYATSNNFVGQPVYTQARAFLQREAAEALVQVSEQLRAKGYGLVIYDGYRPWSVTKMFWDLTPEEDRAFVADPSKGSRHNRGCAVDLSLYYLDTGIPVEMPSDYDAFDETAHPNYDVAAAERTAFRDLLRETMESKGFTVYANEWWHYDFDGWEEYRLLDIPFEEIE